MMLGRYFARFDESPTARRERKRSVHEGVLGARGPRAPATGSATTSAVRASSPSRTGVDSYVPYAGSLKEGVQSTLYKIKSTMCNCGAKSIKELQQKARLTLVSSTSIVEGGAHDVVVKDHNHQTVSYQ